MKSVRVLPSVSLTIISSVFLILGSEWRARAIAVAVAVSSVPRRCRYSNVTTDPRDISTGISLFERDAICHLVSIFTSLTMKILEMKFRELIIQNGI